MCHVNRLCNALYRIRHQYKSSAVVEKMRHAACALVYRHLWPRNIQPHAKIIVLCRSQHNAKRCYSAWLEND